MATITFIGAGTNSTAVNASVSPGFHASTAVGDFVVIQASIRNSGVGDVNLPAGWTNLVYSGHHRIMARFFQAGDTPPTITFSGGVANADTLGQAATFRGVSPEMLVAIAGVASQLNGSAQDIAFPALTMPKDRHAAILAGWKQDDFSAAGIPAGWSSINSLINITAGDDAGQTWRYLIQTTAANLSSGTITITGGASAISRAIVLSLKPAATVTVTLQDAYPPRVLISVTDLTLGDAVTIYRVVSGARTPVRAGSSPSVTDPSFLRIDAELPFGVPVSYVVSVNGTEYTTSPVTYTLTGAKVALSDAVSGLSAEVVIVAWPDKEYGRQASTFRAGARNIAVLGEFTGFASAIELFAEATSIRDNIFALLKNATEGVIQIRQPGGYDGVDCYIAVLTATEHRYSQDGTDDRRTITLDAVETDSWAPSLEARGFTYADLDTAYTGLTYANLNSDYSTYLALAQADLS